MKDKIFIKIILIFLLLLPGCPWTEPETTYSGTYCITDYEFILVIDRSDEEVQFTLETGDGTIEGNGSVNGTRMTLIATLPDARGDLRIEIVFSADGQGFTGQYYLTDSSGTMNGPFNGVKGACPGYGPQGDIEMIAPYQNVSDVDAVTCGFSTTTDCPWGREHNGIDITANKPLIPFVAVSSGKVIAVEKFANGLTGNWQVNVDIKYNNDYEVGYGFEPMSLDETIGNKQLECINVKAGDEVKQGDIIGCLYYAEDMPHVHFMLRKNHEPICPDNYFTPEARASVLELLQLWCTECGWVCDKMCYE